MNLDEITIGQAREIASLAGVTPPRARSPWRVGDRYLIRTVTMAWVGEIVEVHDDCLVLNTASWVASTGRYSRATTPEALDEVEYAGNGIIVGRGAIVDARPWKSELPTETK